mgnify:CR=1 FL=1
MKLTHSPISAASRRVTLTLHLLGVRVDERVVQLASAEDRAALRALNPNNKVPVLEDGELVLWESHAIMTYLCARTPGQALYPTELAARADTDRWLHWISAHLSPAVGGLGFEHIWKQRIGQGPPDPAHVERLLGQVRQFGEVLDRHLATRRWIVGDAVGLADLSVAATLMHAVPGRVPLEPFRHVRALCGRVAELPAWRATEPPQAAA